MGDTILSTPGEASRSEGGLESVSFIVRSRYSNRHYTGWVGTAYGNVVVETWVRSQEVVATERNGTGAEQARPGNFWRNKPDLRHVGNLRVSLT